MKKIIITLLCCITISCTAQYKIYSPTRIYGYLWLNAYETLPVSAGNNVLAISNDTLWIDSDAGWTAVWPTTTSGVVAVTKGGTGFSSYTVGDMLMASSTTALSKLSDVALGSVLVSGGVGAVPLWSKVDLTSHITGVLPTTNGGTGTNDGTLPGYVPESRTVNGHALTGNIDVTKADLGLGNVTDESKATMFTNPAFTGTPTAPTATPGTNTTQIATTAFVLANASAGTVTTSGSPVSGQISYFTGSASVSGNSSLRHIYGTTRIESGADTGLFMLNSGAGCAQIIKTTSTGKALVITDGTDTIMVVDGDSVWFPKFVKSGVIRTGTRFYLPSPNGAVDTGTLKNAYYGLQKKLEPLGKVLRDKRNGEIKWDIPVFDSNGEIIGWKEQYGLAGTGLDGVVAVASKLEEGIRWTFNELIHNRAQYVLILLLLAWGVRLEIKLRRR